MAELDYAFLAEYAKVEAGKLTVVGASFHDIRPPSLPVHHLLFVAGRVRAPEDTETIGIRIRINPPGSDVNVVVDGTVTVGDDPATRYDGKVGVLFTAGVPVPLAAEGLCEIFVDIDEVEQRRLAFEVIAPQQ
jgi:hypothetical protein